MLETKSKCNNGQNQSLKRCERKVGEIRFVQSEKRCVFRRESFLLHFAASLYLLVHYRTIREHIKDRNALSRGGEAVKILVNKL